MQLIEQLVEKFTNLVGCIACYFSDGSTSRRGSRDANWYREYGGCGESDIGRPFGGRCSENRVVGLF